MLRSVNIRMIYFFLPAVSISLLLKGRCSERAAREDKGLNIYLVILPNDGYTESRTSVVEGVRRLPYGSLRQFYDVP